tara:strand:- start:16 stop:831 length:816 start_codon:yes stop_codon:yes gene_type:complete
MGEVTLFETNTNSLTFTDCSKISASSLTVSRAGGYTNTTPWATRTAITLTRCSTVNIQGNVESPGGKAAQITDCDNVKMDVAIETPFFTNGNAAAGGAGAIEVTTSSNTHVDAVMNGETYYHSVGSDYQSSLSLTGDIISKSYANTKRAYGLDKSDRTVLHELGSARAINGGVSSAYKTIKVLVPNSKSLVSRSFTCQETGISLRVGANFWTGGLIAEPNGETTTFERKVIYSNATGSDVLHQVTLEYYNTTGSLINIPAGTKTSFAMSVE